VNAKTQRRIRAAFMRGGTSKAILFQARDLPANRAQWDDIFLAAMGSPDPSGRQLNGMGGGISSLSKVCVIVPSARADADVDYTFGQVLIGEAKVDYSGNCGNMSSAVGPFAVDEGIVRAAPGETTVRIFNTNTKKIIQARFATQEGRFAPEGTLAIPGVAGTGSPIRLDFIDPGGAATDMLLPTGNVTDLLDVPGVGKVEVSMVDAANACVFVAAASLGLTGIEMPGALERDTALLQKLAAIRLQASIAMGISKTLEEARAKAAVPFVGFVSEPQEAVNLANEKIGASEVNLTARMLSSGQPHRALPLAASLCLAVAARIDGTVVNRVTRSASDERLRLAMPSGVLTVGAEVEREGMQWRAIRGSFYRTARRLFDGFVYC
jgi:hypothetical protein